MTPEDATSWNKLIEKVAHGTTRDFPDSSTEDMIQTLWVRLLEAQSRGDLLSPDEAHAESALWYAAKSAAWDERKQHLTISPQYGYRTTDVRTLLETYFEREMWSHSETPEDAESELGNVGLEMQSDMSRAWDKLKTNQKVLIFTHFGLRESVDSKKLSRAISRMADILNSYQPPRRHSGPGRRRILTNAQAVYVLGQQEEE